MKKKTSSVWTNFESIRELVGFIWQGKTWWLTPIVVVLALLSLFVIFLEGSAIAPFIYTLF